MLFGYKILVYCTSKIYENKFCDFISTLNDELVSHNWRVLLFCTESELGENNKNSKGNSNIFDLINYDIADAVLVSEDNIRDKSVLNKIIKNARQRDIPAFVLHGHSEYTYNIKFNQIKGFEKVVRHVVEQHEIRSLHFIGGFKDNEYTRLRLDVFKRILQKNDIPFNDSMVSYGDFWEGPTKKIVQKLIDENRVPQAFICANDVMAIATVSVLKQNGFSCPKDVIVTGFDGIETIFYSNPKITSALCNFQTLGIEVAQFIFEVDAKKLPPSTRLIDPSLIISESCGCQSITPSNSLDFITSLSDAYGRYRLEDTWLNNMSVVVRDCKNVDEVMTALKNDLLYNVFCIVKAECIDDNTNPNVSNTESTYGDSLYVLLDSDCGAPYQNRYITKEQILPPERMKLMMDNYRKPFIFTPINNIDLPLGYVCFCFCNYDTQNYIKVNQIGNWLSNAISGYRNMKYQLKLQQKIEDMYKHDSLTGLYNRNGFMRVYEDIMNDCAIDSISLSMCDLDNLKKINDKYSHNEGDNAIRVVADALSNACPDGYFCRYGGDEIIGLYPYIVDPNFIQQKVEEYIDNYNKISEKPYLISTSIGTVTSTKVSFEEIFAKADELMYKQKITKKNRRK